MADGAAEATAAGIVQAVLALVDPMSPPDSRKAALAYIDSVKNGDIGTLASACLILVQRDKDGAVRLNGFKILQHMVRFRWGELDTQRRTEFATGTFNLISEVASSADAWFLKSQAAGLFAEVVRREEVTVWNKFLPAIVELSQRGPVEAEMVAMILQYLPEDITVHNEDLEGDRRRELLRALADSLPDILTLLYSLLCTHMAAVSSEHAKQFGLVERHAATVTAVLNAVNAYADWAPVPDLAKCGLIDGCGRLLSCKEFREHAANFFRTVSHRRRSADASVEFDSAMNTILQFLMSISSDFFRGHGDDSDFDFAECMCESMGAFASYYNVQCILANESLCVNFLQQMLQYYQHYKIKLHYHSLLFWLTVLKEACTARSVVHDLGDGGVLTVGNGLNAVRSSGKKGLWAYVTEDMYIALFDAALKRMLKKSNGTASVEFLELWSDELEGKSDFSQYRTRLMELVKLIAAQMPLIAAMRVIQRVFDIIVASNGPTYVQDLTALESAQLSLEAVLLAVFNSFEDETNERQIQLIQLFEGLLQKLLLLQWKEPESVVVLGHLLDSYGPFLRHSPENAARVVQKLFELLTSVPISLQDPSANNARHARLQICTSFVRISRTTDKVLLPHMQEIARTMTDLQEKGLLLRGEFNILCEAFMIMASSAGTQQLQDVLAWLLGSAREGWTSLEWQNNYLSDPQYFVHLFANTEFMWSIFHMVTLFEKALKRSGGFRRNFQGSGGTVNNTHPMAFHLPWILPPLIRLLRCVHALWSEPLSQSLPVEIKASKSLSFAEQSGFLGENIAKPDKAQSGYADGSCIDMQEGESKENEVRNWLRGIRDSGYSVLGLSATVGSAFFENMEFPSLMHGLLENLSFMDYRHLRQLIHLVTIPIIRYCPVNLREVWLLTLLQMLLSHCQQALVSSWTSLLHHGRARVPDNFGNLSGLDLKLEVMEEKLLRDLTREVCSVLSSLGAMSFNTGLSCSDRLVAINHPDASQLKDLNSYAPKSIVAFLMLHMGPTIPALKICIDVLGWTDGESVGKMINFYTVLIRLAITTNHHELRQFVANDLFSALIQSLALESNVIASGDLLSLIREIYVNLADKHRSPREILLSLPHVTENHLRTLEEALSKTSSIRDQKLLLRNLLMQAAGDNLKALAVQKSNTIVNVAARPRNIASAPRTDDEGPIGLAAMY